MIEIGIFIVPNNEVNSEISQWKKKFTNKFGHQLYIDHMPHITLANFYTTDLDNLVKKTKNYCSTIKNNLLIKINKTDEFSEDPITKCKTPYYVIDKNQDLLSFQEKLVSNISNFIESKFEINFENNNYNLNNNNYGYPFVGKDWIPHITICSLENKYGDSTLKKEFLKFRPNHRFFVNQIEIYEIKNSEHKKLEEILINVK